MNRAVEYWPEETLRTRIWASLPHGRRDLDEADTDVGALFLIHAEKGFQEECAKLRPEGPQIWAFGKSGNTTRICGYFVNDQTRDDFVVCGVWKGKGKGNSRPHQAEAIVDRAIRIKREGVVFVKAASETENPEPQD